MMEGRRYSYSSATPRLRAVGTTTLSSMKPWGAGGGGRQKQSLVGQLEQRPGLAGPVA